jgi:hypothetical protein
MAEPGTDPFRPGGPVRAAATWLHHVKINRDLESAWPLTHSDYREFLVDTWISRFAASETQTGAGPGALRSALLEIDQPADSLPRPAVWDQFCLTTLAALDALWESIVWEHSGWGTEPRIVAPDHEVVVLFDKATEEPVTLDAPAPLRGFAFELKGADGAWLVSNVVANESEDPDRNWRPGDPEWRPPTQA